MRLQALSALPLAEARCLLLQMIHRTSNHSLLALFPSPVPGGVVYLSSSLCVCIFKKIPNLSCIDPTKTPPALPQDLQHAQALTGPEMGDLRVDVQLQFHLLSKAE